MNRFSLCSGRTLIAAHRGVGVGNIPFNTIPAFRAALMEGADMIELDVDISADGVLFVFHPGKEKAHLGVDVKIGSMSSQKVRAMRYLNGDRKTTQFGLNTLDEVFEEFKNKCLINCDKFWLYPNQVIECIRRHGMEESVLVKSAPRCDVIDILEQCAPDIPYMAIIHDGGIEEAEKLKKRNIAFCAQELIFVEESSIITSDEYLRKLHKDGMLAFVNAEVFDVRRVLSAGHNDDTALCVSLDEGWGWLVRKGFDIIQTDRPALLRAYINGSFQ